MLEADTKKTIADHLQYQMNLGKLWFSRMNSGEVIVCRGERKYKVQLCPEGTPDFLVLQSELLWDGVHATRIPSVRSIFLEVKAPKKKMTRAQEFMKRLLEAQGAIVEVVRSVEEVQNILEG